MTASNDLRLLPWLGPDDKPCYLSADTTNSYMSRLADNAEELQLAAGAEILDQAREVLTDPAADPDELRLLACDLTSALADAIRVAISRGRRLPHSVNRAPEGCERGVRASPN
ncbi:hypothetical protein Slala04_32640 [Streptomyces lavendulae subsp. lavendulae]|nr:hypothetical protein Slala04_32640 [Streptomyces lavendulae subsp. lavendulae]